MFLSVACFMMVYIFYEQCFGVCNWYLVFTKDEAFMDAEVYRVKKLQMFGMIMLWAFDGGPRGYGYVLGC